MSYTDETHKLKKYGTHASYRTLPLLSVPPLPPLDGGHLIGGRRRKDVGEGSVQQTKEIQIQNLLSKPAALLYSRDCADRSPTVVLSVCVCVCVFGLQLAM